MNSLKVIKISLYIIFTSILSIALLIPCAYFQQLNFWWNEIYLNGPISILISSWIILKYIKVQTSITKKD